MVNETPNSFIDLLQNTSNFRNSYNPVGKIAEKAVCRSVFLTTWHCILSVELTKTHLFRLLAILPTGNKYNTV